MTVQPFGWVNLPAPGPAWVPLLPVHSMQSLLQAVAVDSACSCDLAVWQKGNPLLFSASLSLPTQGEQALLAVKIHASLNGVSTR